MIRGSAFVPALPTAGRQGGASSRLARESKGVRILFPLLLFPPVVRIIRRALRKFFTQDAALLVLDPSEWHRYDLTWEREAVIFQVDGQNVLKTSVVPKSNLGLVIWLDNQYMALSPDGRIGYGMHANPEPAWIEVRNIEHQS